MLRGYVVTRLRIWYCIINCTQTLISIFGLLIGNYYFQKPFVWAYKFLKNKLLCLYALHKKHQKYLQDLFKKTKLRILYLNVLNCSVSHSIKSISENRDYNKNGLQKIVFLQTMRQQWQFKKIVTYLDFIVKVFMIARNLFHKCTYQKQNANQEK